MSTPRKYPEMIRSAESGRPLRRGVKRMTIHVAGHAFTYDQPGWWASFDDPNDTEGQLVDDDNIIRRAANREARARAKRATSVTPLVIRAIREKCGLSQAEAGRVFGGGPKAFEKYETGEVVPSGSMMRLLLLAAQRPDLFQKKTGMRLIAEADAELIRATVRQSSVEQIYDRIYGLRPQKRRLSSKRRTKQFAT